MLDKLIESISRVDFKFKSNNFNYIFHINLMNYFKILSLEEIPDFNAFIKDQLSDFQMNNGVEFIFSDLQEVKASFT